MMRRHATKALAAGSVLLALAAPGLTTAASAPTKAPSLPLPALFGRAVFRRLTLSPRGDALAFVVPSRRHRRELLEVLDLRALLSRAAPAPMATRAFPRGVRVQALRWVSPHLLLVVTRTPPPHAGIGFALLDDRGGPRDYRAIRVIPRRLHDSAEQATVLGDSPLGPVVLWRRTPGARPLVFRYDLAMGRTRELCRVPLAGARVLVDRRGWPRLAAVTGARGPAPEVLVARGHCASWTNATARFRSLDLRLYDRFLAVGPHGRGVYFLAPTATAARTLGLYRLSLADLRRTLLVTSPRADVYASRGGRWTSFVWGRRRRRLVGVNFMPGRPRVYWAHPRDPLVRLLRGLGLDLHGEVMRVRGSGPRGRILLLETLGDRNPGRYYLYTRKPTPSLTFLMARHPALHESAMRPLVPVEIPEGHAGVLHAYLVRPRGGHRPGPLVVLAHRGPFGRRFVWFFDPLVQALARAGLAVLAVNYHGSGGYGVLYEREGFRGLTTVIPADLAAAARWALARRLTRPGEVAVLGEGLGGYAALLATALHPGLFAAAVSLDGDVDPARLTGVAARSSDRKVPPGWYWRTLVAPDAAALRSLALVRRAAALRTPVLFVETGGRARGQRALYLRLRRLGYHVADYAAPKERARGRLWAGIVGRILVFLHRYTNLAKAHR